MHDEKSTNRCQKEQQQEKLKQEVLLPLLDDLSLRQPRLRPWKYKCTWGSLNWFREVTTKQTSKSSFTSNFVSERQICFRESYLEVENAA